MYGNFVDEAVDFCYIIVDDSHGETLKRINFTARNTIVFIYNRERPPFLWLHRPANNNDKGVESFSHLKGIIMKKCLFVIVIFAICVPSFFAAEERNHHSITYEKIQSTPVGLPQIGWMGARHSREIESSPWSVGCETLDRDFASFSSYKKYIGELGTKKGRLQSGWAKTEKTKGIYDFAWMDECVYGLHEMGVKPRISLGYGNPIYGSNINLGANVSQVVDNPEGMKAWLKYVETIITRYKDVCDEWEIWNEPYNQEGVYARLLIPTAKLIKKIQPNAITCAETLYSSGSKKARQEMFDAIKKSGDLNIINQWSYHPYVQNPDASYPAIEEFQKEVHAYNPKWEIYQGEVGCPSQLEWTHALDYYSWTEYSQVKWDLRRMFGDRLRNIQTNVFTIVDLKYYNMLQSFGLLRCDLLHHVIYKRPSYHAVQHVMGFFDSTVKPVEVAEINASTNRLVTVGKFDKGGTSILVLWYGDKIPSDDVCWDKIDLTVKKVTFKDPVYIELITGKVYNIDAKASWKSVDGTTTFKGLPVWDCPMMVVERDQIKIYDLKHNPECNSSWMRPVSKNKK